MEQGKAPKVDDLFSLAYSTLFEVVKLARKEEHWGITKEEAGKLGKVSVSCMNTIPVAAKAKVEAKFSKYLPWCALIGFGMVITYPRVVISMEAAKEKKRNRFGPPAKFPTREEAKPSAETPIANPAGIANGGNEKNNGTNFPPGINKNFPPLDYAIPSPADRNAS